MSFDSIFGNDSVKKNVRGIRYEVMDGFVCVCACMRCIEVTNGLILETNNNFALWNFLMVFHEKGFLFMCEPYW